jgi:glycosyltransferase involved in cell wall biosynthesis
MSHQRIVVIANNIDEVGGAQRVVHVLAQGFAERGFDVELIGVTPQPPVHEYLDAPAYRRRVLMSEVWPVGDSSASVKELRSRLRTEARAKLAEALVSGPPGVLLTAQVWAMEIASGIDLTGWRTVGQYHGAFAAAAQGRDLRRVLDAYSLCDASVFLTPSDAQAWQQAGLNNTVALPNPLAWWPEHPFAATSRTVGCISRFSEEKGVQELLEAWSLIVDEVPSWELLLVGSGPDEAQIRERAAALRGVRMMAPVADVSSIFSELGVFVLPSRTEGLPLALMEAMASGLPSVATDCSSGVRLLAGDERAPAVELVPRGDVPELASAIRFLIEDEARREQLARNARERAQEFTLDRVVDQWERLFSRIDR